MPYCKNCGKPVLEDQKFCGYCGKPVSPETADGKEERTQPYPFIATPSVSRPEIKMPTVEKAAPAAASVAAPFVAEKNETASRAFAKTPISPAESIALMQRNRAIKLLIIAFMIGLIVFMTGLAGRSVMNRVSGEVKKIAVVEEKDSDLAPLINSIGHKQMIDAAVAVIKNDNQAIADILSKDTSVLNLIEPKANQILNLIGTSFMPGIVSQLHNQLKEEAGAAWPLLQAMAYYKTMLIVGGAIMLAAAIIWYLKGGRLGDAVMTRMRPALIIGGAYGVFMLIVSNVI